MAYLIGYGLEIVLGTHNYSTYSYDCGVYDSMLISKSLKETADFIISKENLERYI